MTGEVIKSFLVQLGFDIDDAGLSKFNNGIKTASLRVAGLAAAITATAGVITKGISGISKDFEELGYEYRLIAPSINRVLALRREMLKAYSAAGVNIYSVVQNAVKLNFSLNKTKYAFEAIYKSVASKFFPFLTQQSDLLRAKLYQNMPRILAILERFVGIVFQGLDAIIQLGGRLWSIFGRVYDFLVDLDKATNGWSTKILAVVAAWNLLNLSFLATPLGAIITGLVALLALYDDFKTFQEGGKSLFNWGPVIPYIDAITHAVAKLVDYLTILWELPQKIGTAFGNLVVQGAQAIGSFFGSNPSNVGANLGNNPSGPQLSNPLGGSSTSNQTNQNVNQQTTINVSSTADANAVAKQTAGEQGRVQMDLVRYLGSVTR